MKLKPRQCLVCDKDYPEYDICAECLPKVKKYLDEKEKEDAP